VTLTHTPPTAPAPSPGRTLSSVASDGVSFLVYWLVILLLLGAAVTSVLRPPDGNVAVGLVTGLICLVWATFCLTLGVLRVKGPDGADVPPPGWLVVVTSAGCLVSLGILRSSAGLSGPWPAEILAAGLLVASLTVWRGPVVGGVSAVLIAAAMLVAPLRGSEGEQLLRTPLGGVVPAVTIVAAGFSVALALWALGRTALGLERSLDARDEALVREEEVRASAQVAAEVERSLHDTALNTLETIAAHGDHLDRRAVVARCSADHQRLAQWRSETLVADLPEVLRGLDERARLLGLTVETALVGESGGPSGEGAVASLALPTPVLGALAGAGAEALTNVHKHAGVNHATILARHDPMGVQVFVADEGVGAAANPDGFGMSRSIRDRMAAVGGQALIGPGPQSRGTVVLLEWQPTAPPSRQIGADLLQRTAGIVLMVATFLSGVACAMVVLGWPAYDRPWLALAGAVAPVMVGAGILGRARDGMHVGTAEVLAACATYVLVGALALLADPFCSSLLREGATLDARVPMMAVLILVAPRPGVLGAVVATVGLAHLAGALAWNELWVLCGADTATAGVYVVATLAAAWLFVERIDRMGAELSVARDQAIAAQVRLGTELRVRAEEELWVADTLASAQELLDDIAQGRRDPVDPGTRDACAAQAEFLRALLAVGGAPDQVRRPARIWLRLLNAGGCQIRVRGTFEGCAPPPGTIGEVGGVVDVLCALAPGSTVTLSSWAEPGPALVLAAAGSPVARAGQVLLDRIHHVTGDAWLDVSTDGVTLEWSWPGAGSAGGGEPR
jgi:signal transduction histidine kinase